MEIKIVATTGRARGQSVDVKAAKFFIGHHENCQVRPNISGLAGIHALIEQRDGRIYLRDFGAEGGTGLNDRVLIARETEVFDGDLIQVGPMVLTLVLVPKGDRSIPSHAHVAEGWPFLEEVAAEPLSQPDEPSARLPIPRYAAESLPKPTRSTPMGEPYVATSVRPEPSRLEPVVSIPAAPAFAGSSHATSTLTRSVLLRPVARTALACELVEGVLVATILPTHLDEESAVSPVRYELRAIMEENPPGRMVVDLKQTRYLSSRAVGVILAHYQAMERLGGTLRVCGVSREIKPVLDQMRLSMLIDIYPTGEEAVQDPWE